jgi:hypothetical protein
MALPSIVVVMAMCQKKLFRSSPTVPELVDYDHKNRGIEGLQPMGRIREVKI